MQDKEEYVLLIIKPDGVKKHCTEDIIEFFKEKGLYEVFRKRKRLTKQFIRTSFSAKCMKDELEEYLSSGESEAILLKGKDAYECVRLGKVEYRKKNNVHGKVQNLIHSPEAGNEYEKQLYFFFPNIYNLKYCMYSDLYAKPSYCDEEMEFIKCLLNYDNKTNSKTVYVFQCDEFEKYYKFYKRYTEIAQKDNWLFGVEYLCDIDGKQLSLVGYYKNGNLNKERIIGINGNKRFENIVKIINGNDGVAYLGFSRELLSLGESTIEKIRKLGVIGIVLYHPSYTIEETAYIREKFLPKQFQIAGGSGGIAEIGRYSISNGMFQSLYNNVFKLGERYKNGK